VRTLPQCPCTDMGIAWWQRRNLRRIKRGRRDGSSSSSSVVKERGWRRAGYARLKSRGSSLGSNVWWRGRGCARSSSAFRLERVEGMEGR
jgi:hypothetical protein